jgi:hypothetical protein
MRLDLTLEMERPQAVIQKRSEKEYRNERFSLSREKGKERLETGHRGEARA